jgi:hypothetical protein
MAQPSILNLDALKIVRTVTIAGRDRSLRSMSVAQFIEGDLFDQKLAQAQTPYARTDLLVDLALQFLDDTAREELLALDMAQLMALIAFARGADLAPQATEEEGDAGNGAAGSS